MDDNVELIRSNKGGLKLIHRGYMYTVHKRRLSGGIRWRCSQRTLHCKGSISTGDGPPKVNMPHNHIPDPHSVALARCRQFEEITDPTLLVETECETADDFFQPQKQSNILLDDVRPMSSDTEFKLDPFQDGSEWDAEEVCLRWNSHHSNIKSSFPILLQREQYVDVTLSAEKKMLKCHRLVLSSCSTYFEELLAGVSPNQHPVVFLTGIPFWILKTLIDFMYAGEVYIEQNNLEPLLKVAEMLQIKGLTGKINATDVDKTDISKCTERKVNVMKLCPEQVPSPAEPPTPEIDKIFSKSSSVPTTVQIDPMSLLEPTYFEENTGPIEVPNKNSHPPVIKKQTVKKAKKRKFLENERVVSPPAVYRKGTKSRPQVRVPRHYLNEYDRSECTKTRKVDARKQLQFQLDAVKSDVKKESVEEENAVSLTKTNPRVFDKTDERGYSQKVIDDGATDEQLKLKIKTERVDEDAPLMNDLKLDES